MGTGLDDSPYPVAEQCEETLVHALVHGVVRRPHCPVFQVYWLGASRDLLFLGVADFSQHSCDETKQLVERVESRGF